MLKTEDLEKFMPLVPENKFIDFIPKTLLKLDQTTIDTVSFIFWFCYMAEIEIYHTIKTVYNRVTEKYSMEEGRKMYKDVIHTLILNEFGGKPRCEACGNKKYYDIENLDYFIDKIKVASLFMGKDHKFIKILWKLNGLRNEISHNRLSNLIYNKQNLCLRTTKEELLFDYKEASLLPMDKNKSPVWLASEQIRKNGSIELKVD